MSLFKAFRAGFTRRWHSNPDLAHICDRVDGHSARVARIILMLHPNPTPDLLRAALTHDDGESVVGDISAISKEAHPEVFEALKALELKTIIDIWGEYPALDTANTIWLKFADRLDAFMWAAHHAPHVMAGDGWPEAGQWLLNQCDLLLGDNHTRREVKAMISEMGKLDAARERRIELFDYQFQTLAEQMEEERDQ